MTREANDWPALLREAPDDLDFIRYLWVLAHEEPESPERTRLIAKIEALGRAARKRAERLGLAAPAEQASAEQAPVGRDRGEAVVAPVPSSDVTAPTDRSPRVSPLPERRFTLDAAAEVADFAGAVRAELAKRDLPDVSNERLTEALAAWHAAVTVQGDPLRFVSWPGWTGQCLAMWLVGRYPQMGNPEPIGQDSRVWELTQPTRKLLTLGWLDTEAGPLPGGKLLCEMDINAQFLAAARSALLGDGEPIELDAEQVARWNLVDLVKLPGYVVLASPPDLSGLPRHVIGGFAKVTAGRKTILPTPLALYLVRDHQVRLDVAEAVVWHTRPVHDARSGKTKQVTAYGKRLAKWAEIVADGRAALMRAADDQGWDHPAALALLVLKKTYSQYIGSMLRSTEHNVGKDGGPTGWLRPDWYDQIIATATANLLRSLDKAAAAGWHALGVLKDSAWLLADGVDLPPDPDIPAAPARLADDRSGRWERLTGMQVDQVQPGRWKLARHAQVDDDLQDAFAKGRPQPLRKALGAADQARRTT